MIIMVQDPVTKLILHVCLFNLKSKLLVNETKERNFLSFKSRPMLALIHIESYRRPHLIK
jgi:hypothetical protein